jgi:hypothetical protein
LYPRVSVDDLESKVRMLEVIRIKRFLGIEEQDVPCGNPMRSNACEMRSCRTQGLRERQKTESVGTRLALLPAMAMSASGAIAKLFAS